MQSPFEDVTTVRPSWVELETEAAPDPECTTVVLPAPVVVEPDTWPPPAVTELVIPLLGARSPGLSWTVLQF